MLSRRGPLFTPSGDCKVKKKSGIMVRISRVLFPEIAMESASSSAAPASRRISSRLVDMKCDCLVNLDQPATNSKTNKRKKVRSKSKRRQSIAKESDPNLHSNDKENEQVMPRQTRLSSEGIDNSRRRSVGSSILTNLSSIQNTKTKAVRRRRAVKSKKKDEAVGTTSTDKEHVNTTKTQQRYAQRNRRQSTSSVLENLSTLTVKENRVSFISPHTPIHESMKSFKASPVPWNSSKKISSPHVFEEDALTPSVAPKGAKRIDDKATPDFISGVNHTNKSDSQSVAVDNIIKTNSTTPVIVRDENRVIMDKCMQTPVQVQNQVMSPANSMNRSCNMSLDSIVASPDDGDVRISSLNSRLMDVEVDEKVDRGKVETTRDANQDNQAFDSENVGVEPKTMEVGADMPTVVSKSVNNTKETEGQKSETTFDVSEEKSSSNVESSKAKKVSEATLANTCSSSPLQNLRRSARASKKVERLVVSFRRKSKTKSSEEAKETNDVDDNRKESEETPSLSTNKEKKSFLKKAKSPVAPVDKKSSNEVVEREKVETQPSEARKSSRTSIPTERLTVRSFRVKAKKKKATTKKEREDGQDLIGARVAKFFCRKLYTGEVISFNGKYWKVRYEDEDEEDLSRHEVEAAISLLETKGKKKVKKSTSLNNKKGNDGTSLDEVSQKTEKSEPPNVLNTCREHDHDLLSNGKMDNTQSEPRKWTDDMIKSLKVAHSKADPTSISFWQDISRMVGERSAEECRDKWFDFSGSPSRKTKKTGKNSSKAKVSNRVEEKDEDDLFSSTPMKLSNPGLLKLPSSKQKIDAKASTFNKVVDLFSSPLLNRRKKPEKNCDSSEKKLFFRPQYKSYLNDIRIGRVGGISKITRVNKNDKQRHIRASVDDGDYEADASLSPGGTLRVKANFDDSDSEMSEC